MQEPENNNKNSGFHFYPGNYFLGEKKCHRTLWPPSLSHHLILSRNFWLPPSFTLVGNSPTQHKEVTNMAVRYIFKQFCFSSHPWAYVSYFSCPQMTFLQLWKAPFIFHQPFQLYDACSHTAVSYQQSNHAFPDAPWCPGSCEIGFLSAQHPGKDENLRVPLNSMLALKKGQHWPRTNKHLTVTKSS